MEPRPNETQTKQFNSELKTTVNTFYQRLDQLWFGTRNPFIAQDELHKSIIDIQTINEQIRQIFVEKSLELLFDAIEKDIEQFRFLADKPKRKIRFNIYHTEHLNAEKTAQEGYEFKPTIGFTMANGVTNKGEPIGDLLEVRFVSKEEISINEFTDTSNLSDLLEIPDEAFMQYSKMGEDNKVEKSVLLRISGDGVQKSNPIYAGQNIDELIDVTAIGDESDYIDFDLATAAGMVDLINRLVEMKLVRSKSTTA